MEAQSEEVKDVAPDIRPTAIRRLWNAIGGHKVPFFSLILFGALAIKSFSPDILFAKRHKSYRFKASALGFFVGDLSLFNTSTAQEAEQSIVQVFPQKLQPKVAQVIRPVLSMCEKHGVDPFWVLSVMWTESHFRFEATSKKGASGLMQVMPETYAHLMTQIKAEGIKLESDLGERYLAQTYPEAYQKMGYSMLVQKLRNLEIGIYYLRNLLNEFDNNHFHATVAYNMGPHWTKERLKNDLPVGKKNHYLHKVMQAYLHITKNLSHNANVSFIP